MKKTNSGITISCSTDSISNWAEIPNILSSVGMACHTSEQHRLAFESSYVTIFLFDGENLVGFGRAISDGVYQAAVYDCAVRSAYQGRGLGSMIVSELLSRLDGFTTILYAAPGKEGFYERLGFKKMKTGMARFANPEVMTEKGFTE